jgi:hypothetical protein
MMQACPDPQRYVSVFPVQPETVQIRVAAIRLKQLRVGAPFQDLAVLENEALAGMASRGEAAGDDEAGAAGHQAVESGLEAQLAPEIRPATRGPGRMSGKTCAGRGASWPSAPLLVSCDSGSSPALCRCSHHLPITCGCVGAQAHRCSHQTFLVTATATGIGSVLGTERPKRPGCRSGTNSRCYGRRPGWWRS